MCIRDSYGYHLDEGRRANWIIEIACPVRSIADFGALGYLIGKQVGNGCLWFSDLGAWLPPLPADVTSGGAAGDRLKTLGAALAGYGAVALYHIAGYTPEAAALGESLIQAGARRLRIESLAPAYAVMDANPEAVSYTHLDVYKRQAMSSVRVSKTPAAVCTR